MRIILKLKANIDQRETIARVEKCLWQIYRIERLFDYQENLQIWKIIQRKV